MKDKEQVTVGIHPKVKVPASALAAIGVVLIVLGFVLTDDTLKQEGIAIAGSGGVGGILGFLAPLGVTTGGSPPAEPTVTQEQALTLPDA